MDSKLDLAQVLASTAATFGVGLTSGYFFTRWKARKRPAPRIGGNLRIRATSGIYRSRLIAIDAKTWRISAPLSRDHYVPFRAGDHLTIEAPCADGVYVFHTEVQGRDAEAAEIILKAPDGMSPTNRRTETRITTEERVTLDGLSGQLKNVSPNGARVWTDGNFERGDRVRLEMHDQIMEGWVVDVWPIRGISDFRDDVRIRFEEEITVTA